MSYYDSVTTTSIWRCSQPLTGVFGQNRNKGDEELLRLIGLCNSHKNNVQNTVLIHDSRPKTNAYANRAKGGGFEDSGAGKNYPNCKIMFADIDNIHKVTDVYKNLCTFSFDMEKKLKEFEEHEKLRDPQQLILMLDKTDYRYMLQMILIGVNDVLAAMTSQHFENVVVHCSDGWDRTSQISSTSQLLLDPFYRTFEGFQVLIEKDWLSFGHMFGRRCGHFSATDTGNRSQVFIQWLDTVHQLWHQMPSLFEFSTELLLFLAENLFNCKYGTFLLNNCRERQETKIHERTLSIWVEVNLRRKEFGNAYYLPVEKQPQKGRITQVPQFAYKDMRIWHEYFYKYTSVPRKLVKGNANYIIHKKTHEQRERVDKLQALLQRTTKLA